MDSSARAWWAPWTAARGIFLLCKNFQHLAAVAQFTLSLCECVRLCVCVCVVFQVCPALWNDSDKTPVQIITEQDTCISFYPNITYLREGAVWHNLCLNMKSSLYDRLNLLSPNVFWRSTVKVEFFKKGKKKKILRVLQKTWQNCKHLLKP